jgi:hypothetical protein
MIYHTDDGKQNPPRKPPPSLFSAVIHHIQVAHPVEYQLPEEIRTFFKDGLFIVCFAQHPYLTHRNSWHWSERNLRRHRRIEATPIKVNLQKKKSFPLAHASVSADMGNWRIEIHIVSETVMGVPSCVMNVGSRHYRTAFHRPPLLRNGLDGRRPLHLMRGKVLCRVITAIYTGILIVLNPLFRHYLLLTRNGCVPIISKESWSVYHLLVVTNTTHFVIAPEASDSQAAWAANRNNQTSTVQQWQHRCYSSTVYPHCSRTVSARG